MLQFVEVLRHALPTVDSLTLPWDMRQKSRFLARLDSGPECSCLLPRGTVLRDGDILRAASGEQIRVRAAPEQLSVARTADPQLQLRAAYHLGNRHVAVELRQTHLAYQHDHVLDDMLRELGLHVGVEVLPFAPESGAYRSGHGHGHHHGHGHDHGHEHGHEPGHRHD